MSVNMDVRSAAEAMSGSAVGENVAFAGVSTDSRTVATGELFFALRGDNFDGHQFIAAARERGAHRVQTWALAEDEARTAFLSAAGFGPAGARRKIEVGQTIVTEHCWHTAI